MTVESLNVTDGCILFSRLSHRGCDAVRLLTCGMVVAAVALLEKNPNPSDQEIVRAMNGHICRCGVYQRIVTAIKQAAKAMREEKR